MDDDTEDCSSFELWRLPGRKCLTHDGACISARIQTARQTFHLRFGNNLASGKRFGYLLPASDRITESLQAIAALSRLYHSEKVNQSNAVFDRPARAAIYHFRTLQALDGVSVGASQREIATVLVGEEMAETEWSADSALRAQVRALIQRGHRLRNGGYRQLLGAHRPRAQGGIE